MNILSLCDGISCGQMAFEKLGVKVDRYYASEIKDIAIDITTKNFPKTIQLGDVTKITYKNGVLYSENGEYKESFDIVIFGSPCQSFSRAMNKAKRIGVEDKIRSGIFLECSRILKEINPKYFLMENVVMKKEDEDLVSDFMGVKPIRINSSLITAQMRDRLYWTNIPNVTIPNKKETNVSDVLTDGYYPYEKTRCLMRNDSHGYYNGCNWTPCKRFYRWYFKAFSTMVFKDKSNFETCVKEFEKITQNNEKISASLFDNYVGDAFNGTRYLWKEERAKLQTIPIKYISSLSEKDASDLIGDGWTVDVIVHILSYLPKEFLSNKFNN